MVIWLLQRNVLMQLHTYIYLLPAKVTHKRLTADDTSETMSESIIEETPRPNKDGTYGDSADPTIAALGSRDLTAMFEGFRSAFAENAICEKDQQLILKALEHKSPSDIRLFMQYTKTHVLFLHDRVLFSLCNVLLFLFVITKIAALF